ncbi:MAG: hypothetical protein KGQ47_16920, partial [Hyphomicrobiales bacterium]|nr:hypothetical protein [Hyphomicrobiales bacterium]
PTQFGKPDSVVKFWSFAPIFENSGNTITNNLRIHPYAAFSNFPLPIGGGPAQQILFGQPSALSRAPVDPEEVPIFPPAKVQNYIIGPHSTLSVGAIDVPSDVVKLGAPIWDVFGFATYDDVFPKTPQHITKYCYRIFPIPETGDQKPQIGVCAHWNCTDKECDADKETYKADPVLRTQTLVLGPKEMGSASPQ